MTSHFSSSHAQTTPGGEVRGGDASGDEIVSCVPLSPVSSSFEVSGRARIVGVSPPFSTDPFNLLLHIRR